MNDIINPYIHFIIVYIDDVLVYSDSIEQHYKHLSQFHKIAKVNGILLFKQKMSLAKDKIFRT